MTEDNFLKKGNQEKMTPLFFNTFSTIISLSQKSNHKIITLIAKMTEDIFFTKGNQEKKEKKLHLYSSTPSALSQKSNHKIISQKIRQKKGKNR